MPDPGRLGQPFLEQLGHRDAYLAVLTDSGFEEQLRFEVAGDAWRALLVLRAPAPSGTRVAHDR